MSIFTSKWMLLALIPVAVLLVLFLIGKKSVHHEIIINATPEQVWEVLTDLKKYPEWNPVMIRAQGTLSEGQKITYTFRQDDSNQYDIPATVKAVKTAQLLNQTGGMPGVITYDHRYVLDADGVNTKLTIHEDYRGVYVPFWDPQPVQSAYERLNEAIKARVLEKDNHE